MASERGWKAPFRPWAQNTLGLPQAGPRDPLEPFQGIITSGAKKLWRKKPLPFEACLRTGGRHTDTRPNFRWHTAWAKLSQKGGLSNDRSDRLGQRQVSRSYPGACWPASPSRLLYRTMSSRS